ncbi:hypothetical protein ACFWN5_19765 [Streptomyces sp. NPDC058430]|uniref:hypothetical protein n=1 Tax=Streptomyces sp. NPDC058430 TaxID=3346495 RepID=UPI0036640808
MGELTRRELAAQLALVRTQGAAQLGLGVCAGQGGARKRRLEHMRARTDAERAALLPPTSPLRQAPPDTHRPGHRPPTR